MRSGHWVMLWVCGCLLACSGDDTSATPGAGDDTPAPDDDGQGADDGDPTGDASDDGDPTATGDDDGSAGASGATDDPGTDPDPDADGQGDTAADADADMQDVDDADPGDDPQVSEPAGSVLLVGVGPWGLRARSSDGSDWSFCGNPSTGNDHTPDLLRNVAYGDGVFIAVGGDANSMVMRSLDGAHWEEDLHPTTACEGEAYPPSCTSWMGGVAYGDGVWLAGGGNGALMRSMDGGLSWTGLHPDPRPRAVRDVAFGAGRFVVGADMGMVGVTEDAGETWTLHTLWDYSMSVTYGDGTFIASGANWNGSGFDRACFVSTDAGDSFEACDGLVADSDSFVHDGSRWLASTAAGYATSEDGVVWEEHTDATLPSALLHDGERLFGRSGSNIRSATDPATWTTVAMNVGNFRGWTAGRVYDSNLPISEPAECQDNR